MSVAEAIPTWDDTETDVLLLRRAALEADILEIEAQLKDGTRHGFMGSAAYYRWKGAAQFALSTKRGEIKLIKAVILKRRRKFEREQRKAREARRNQTLAMMPAYVMHTAEEHEAIRIEAQQKRARMLEELQDDESLDALLLRVKRAMSHMIHGDGPPPDTFDEADREASRELTMYLRDQFGTQAVKDFVNDRLDNASSGQKDVGR